MPPDFISQSSLWGPLFAVMIFAALVLLAALIQVGIGFVVSPNPPKDTDGRREGSGRGWVRELQGRWPGLLG